MAGSLKFFKYTTSGGAEFAIKMDESNGEAIGNTDLVDADLPINELPRNIIPRYSKRPLDESRGRFFCRECSWVTGGNRQPPESDNHTRIITQPGRFFSL